MLLALIAATGIALVTQDQVALRATPSDSAPTQAQLWAGDSLEVRGSRLDYLQVWDHRRERGGYVRASQVRMTSLEPQQATDLMAVVRFLRETPGAESLGIAYTAAYLRSVPAPALTAEPFDALGTFADRLADRASARQGSAAITAHLEVAASYGVKLDTLEREGTMRICYDGEAFRRVLAIPGATAEQRARAALGLTRAECIDPDLLPGQRHAVNRWRADVLDRVEPAQFAQLGEAMKNRLHMRRAAVWSTLAFEAMRFDDTPAASAAQRSLDELAAVNLKELSDDDQVAYHDAAIRAGSSRWAAQSFVAASAATARLSIETQPGQPGETCVMLVDPSHDAAHALLRRCTFGTVWTGSASVNPNQKALALAVQPLDGWRELWLFRKSGANWIVDIVPPSIDGPELGYVEFAGWVPGGERMLVARETSVDGRYKRRFEVLRLDSLAVEKWATQPDQVGLFLRWQDPVWKRTTVSVR